MLDSILFFHSTLRCPLRTPLGAQGIAQYKRIKNTKFLEFNSSWGHFYTKLLISICFFYSYLKGAPWGPPTARRMDPMEMGQKQKVLIIIFQLGSSLWKNAEFHHLIPLISLGLHPEDPVGAQGWTMSKSCIYKNFLHFQFSWGPFYDKSPNSPFFINSILGHPEDPGGPGVDGIKKGQIKKVLRIWFEQGCLL